LVAADEAGGTAYKVGLLLWHLKGLKKTPENLAVTRKVAWDRLKIGRMALTRGLDRLEAAKLITTTRGRGKAIRVTILPACSAGACNTPLADAGMPLEGQ